jgi:hypothetical protein
MSIIEVGTTGSSRQSWDDYNPRPLLEKLMRNFKGDLSLRSSREEIIEQFIEQRLEGVSCKDKRQECYLEAIIKYWAHNNYNALLDVIRGRDKVTAAERVRLKAEMIAKANRAIEVKWFTYTMPNGKKLSECTGDDLASMRALLNHNMAKLIGAVRPKQKVKTVFNREQLQEFLA